MLAVFEEEWDYVLIPDCRFPNEFELLRERWPDTILVRVVRPDYDTYLTAKQSVHPSETAMDDYHAHYTVRNDGTLDHLQMAVAYMLFDIAFQPTKGGDE